MVAYRAAHEIHSKKHTTTNTWMYDSFLTYRSEIYYFFLKVATRHVYIIPAQNVDLSASVKPEGKLEREKKP